MKKLLLIFLLTTIFGCIDSTEPVKGRPAEPVTDIDGHTYETVKIGEQVWMAENLRVTHYSNGDPIPNITSSAEWSQLTTDAYADYFNDPSISEIYGRYYNWYAVDDDRGLCPEGWRVPSNSDWTILTDSQGGGAVAGGRLKATGTIERGNGLWRDPNTGASNTSLFSVLPADLRLQSGAFHDSLGYYAYIWTSSGSVSNRAWERRFFFGSNPVGVQDVNKRRGQSVRCVRDEP